MDIKRLIYSPVGKIAISIMLGLGLATLFKRVCKNRNCLVFHAAPLDQIKGKIFKHNDKCYTFTEKSETCNPNKKTLEFA
jgi:hypothetical protein